MAISINRTPLTGSTRGEDVPEDSDFRKIDDGDSAAERAQKAVDKAREKARRARKLEEEKQAHEGRKAQKRKEWLMNLMRKALRGEREKREKWNDGLDQRLLKLNAGRILKYIHYEARMGNQQCTISEMELRLSRMVSISIGGMQHLRSGNRKKAREKEFISFLESEGFKVKSMDISLMGQRGHYLDWRQLEAHKHAELVELAENSKVDSSGTKADIISRLTPTRCLYLSANISWEKAEVDDFIKVDPKELKDADTKKR